MVWIFSHTPSFYSTKRQHARLSFFFSVLPTFFFFFFPSVIVLWVCCLVFFPPHFTRIVLAWPTLFHAALGAPKGAARREFAKRCCPQSQETEPLPRRPPRPRPAGQAAPVPRRVRGWQRGGSRREAAAAPSLAEHGGCSGRRSSPPARSPSVLLSRPLPLRGTDRRGTKLWAGCG